MAQPESETIEHLVSMWRAAIRRTAAETGPADLAVDPAREIGHYAGETLHALAVIGAELLGAIPTRDRAALDQGVSLAWFGKMRALPNRQTLEALAFVADMLHAAVDGVRATGREDLDDAHDLAVRLQECLAACAGSTGIVEGLQQLLAEAAGGED